ncbi:MAG: hypothetical protein WBZ11_07045, partial [Candidatus Sulfotelmatobacter sp.]
PIGTPGCTGGGVGAGRTGALYTGRGPVCGTIMRGGGVAGAMGLGGTTVAAGAPAETTGRAGGGTDVAGGRIGVTEDADAEGCALTGDGGAATGRGAIVETGVETAPGAGDSVAGFTGGGATVVGRLTAAGGAATVFSTAAGGAIDGPAGGVVTG